MKPLQDQARTVALVAVDQVLDAGFQGLDPALDSIRQLPVSHRLEPLLNLLDEVVIIHYQSRTRNNLDAKRRVIDAINVVAMDLELRDRRKILAKYLACIPYLDDPDQEWLWRCCLQTIKNTNAAAPQDIGPVVVALATYLPYEFTSPFTSEHKNMRAMINELRNGDPHREAAKTAFEHNVVKRYPWAKILWL